MNRLIHDLKSNSFKRLYYFYGKDVVSVELLVKTAISCIVPNGDDFNIYKLDGNALNLQELSDVTESFPMFADHKCITIHDLNCESLNADYLKQLLNILDNAPDTSIIVFYVTGFDVKNGKKYPTAKNKKLIDYISKNGVVFEAIQKTLPQTVKDIQTVCKQHGNDIDYQNAQLIANKCLCNSLTIKSELKKLLDYAQNQTITKDMIDNLVYSSYDVNAFEFSRAVVSMNSQLSFKILNELYSLRSEPIAILSAVSMAFIDLYRVKTAINYNHSEHEILSDYNYKGREFVIKNYLKDSNTIRLEHLRECINILKQTNLLLVSSTTDKKFILEKAVAEMINVGYKYY